MELYYETEWYKPPPELAPALKNQAQRFPARGVNVRRLDHMNLLDLRRRRAAAIPGGRARACAPPRRSCSTTAQEAGGWVTCNNKSYDLAFTRDHYGAKGRFHHVTYALDSREDILRAADIFLENGVPSRPGRTSTRSSRPSSSTSTSPAATASRWPMPARG